MSQRRWAVGLLCLGLAAGCGDPELTFFPGAGVLYVAQQASILVTSGGDGSDLVESSLKLVDGEGTAFGAQELQATEVSGDETQFVVPAGIATGKGTLSVETSKGPSFSGEVGINRLMAMRDLSGKIWLLALTGSGAGAQFAEAKAGNFGTGFGQVAIGYEGRLLATTSRSSGELFLAWVDPGLKPSTPHTISTTETINDLLVTPNGVTLVATSGGVYYAPAPTQDPPVEPTLTLLNVGETVALAADPAGGKAAAVVDPGSSGNVALTILDLTMSPPLAVQTLSTTWSGGGHALSVAMSSDGKSIVLVDGTDDKLALFGDGQTTPTEQSFPSGESGAVAIAAAPDGSTFYVANKTSGNLSKVTVSAGAATFDSPLDLTSGSGAPVDVRASTSDEVVVLLEHDLVLLYDAGAKANTLKPTNLVADKVNGEVGGSLAIQP